jgi:hypothetical protein
MDLDPVPSFALTKRMALVSVCERRRDDVHVRALRIPKSPGDVRRGIGNASLVIWIEVFVDKKDA